MSSPHNYLILMGYVFFILGGVWLIERFTAWVTAGLPTRHGQALGAPLCADCGVPLHPHEVAIDLGEGHEEICDACLFGPKAN